MFGWIRQIRPIKNFGQMKNSIEYYKEYVDLLAQKSDDELIYSFNVQVGNFGWGVARSGYLSALHKVLELKEIDYSEIGTSKRMSYRNHVYLVGDKLFLLSTLPYENLINIVYNYLCSFYLNIKKEEMKLEHVDEKALLIKINTFPFLARITSSSLAGLGKVEYNGK